MRLTFWLLDVNYENVDNKPELWLWGADASENRVLIVDRNFKAYFYAVLKERANPETAAKEVQSLKNELPFILEVAPQQKKYFGKPVNCLKITVQNPDEMPKYAKALKKLDFVEECLEDDVRLSMRYLIDNDVSPCEWHEVEVEHAEEGYKAQVDRVYHAKSFPKRLTVIEVPKLKVLGFSMVCYSEKGMPKPDKNPVVIISVQTNTGEERQFTSKNQDDRPVVKDFVDYVRQFNPDIIAGFGTNHQDWPYLIGRAKKSGSKLTVDRVETEPHTSVYGHVSVTGRANVDLYDFMDELPDIKLKKLDNVADYLGIICMDERTAIEDIEYASYWKNEKKRATLLKFSKENVTCVLGVADALLDFAMQLSALVGLPLDHVGTAAVGFRVESYLMRNAQRIGELIPKRVERPYFPYVGGLVLEPKTGMHENVAVLDFKAMYPSLMIAHNISPDTYLSPGEPEPSTGVDETPETKYRFRKQPPGFYKEVLSSLIMERDSVRAKLEELNPKGSEYRVLDARQRAIKVITNATYGYAGWIGARWYTKPVAEAAAAWGRHTIRETIETAKRLGLEVVYGDTDSVFIKHEPEKVVRLTQEIGKNLGLEIKPDKVYVRILFTEAKKRYCGLLPNGQLDIVGLEVVRGDWADVARKSQENVLKILLKEQSPKKALEYVRQYITDLRIKKIPYRDLIIWKTLTKRVDEYAVKAPHVEAAKLLKKEGWELSTGDKIGYVITAGKGRLYTRAKPFTFASYDEVDIDYYVTNQVVPAVSRILSVFGIKEEELLSQKEHN